MLKLLDEINYLTLSIYSLIEENPTQPISKELARQSCKQLFLGKAISFEGSLRTAVDLGLLLVKGGQIYLTKFGKHFVLLNKGNEFEANSKQIKLIRDNVKNTTLLLKIISVLENKIDKSELLLPAKQLVKELDLKKAFKNDSIRSDYTRCAFAMKAGTFTDEDLQEQLRQKIKYGGNAEKYIVCYERERLKREGFTSQSKKVRRVGNIDILCGYDVESFTGNTKKPNRFIEVKCTKGDFIKFYWSAHEIKIAKLLKDKYFIYFVWLDNVGKPFGKLEIFQNPAKSVLKSSRFNIFPGKLVVVEN